MEIELSVEGMTCHHCSGRVEKYLKSKTGISNVFVDLDNNQATFSSKAGLDLDELVRGINELGYKAGLKQNNPEQDRG